MCSNLAGFSVAPKEVANSPIAIAVEGLIIVLETKTTFLAAFNFPFTLVSIADQVVSFPLFVGFCKRAASYKPKTDAIICAFDPPFVIPKSLFPLI